MSARALPDVTGVRHTYHRAGEVRLHLAEAGEGEPLVLLHGFPQHWYVWRSLIEPLAREYRVLCPDLRGFGWSEAPRRGYDRETLMRDVLALLDELKVARFRLIGHDWGGWIGYLIGLFAPERLEQLVVLGIHHPFWRPGRVWAMTQWRGWHGYVLGAPGLGPRAAAGRSKLSTPVFRWLGSDVWGASEKRVFLDQFKEPERARAAALLYRDFGRIDVPRMLAGRYRRMGPLRTRALLLRGTRDTAVQPVRASDYGPYAPNLTVERVEGGHSIVDERPQLVLERSLAFFRRVA